MARFWSRNNLAGCAYECNSPPGGLLQQQQVPLPEARFQHVCPSHKSCKAETRSAVHFAASIHDAGVAVHAHAVRPQEFHSG